MKEDDGDSDIVAPRPQRQHPYYVTPAGYDHLQQRLAQAQAGNNAREVEEAQSRLEEAVVVNPLEQPTDVARFGANVTVRQPDGKQQSYRIVGEDEGDPAHGTISWLSPLAQALIDRRAGDRVVWERPAGNIALEIVSIQYA